MCHFFIIQIKLLLQKSNSFGAGNVIAALLGSMARTLHFQRYETISHSLSLSLSTHLTVSTMLLFFPGPGEKTLTHNNGRKTESTGEETRCKRRGVEVVNRPQLPQHQGSPRRKRRGREPGPWRPVGRAGIHYCHRRHSSPDSQG